MSQQDGTKSGNRIVFQQTDEKASILQQFRSLVAPLHEALGPNTEIILHDLAKLPDSIAAISGSLTGRKVGDPSTDLLIKEAAKGFPKHMIGYRTTLPDGRRLKSSTLIIRDHAGTPVAALCINADVTAYEQAKTAIDAILSIGAASPEPEETADAVSEQFVHSVDELTDELIRQALEESDKPVDRMKKKDKVAIVRSLHERGFFVMKEAVPEVAKALGVTRFTIYNYLNEIRGEEA